MGLWSKAKSVGSAIVGGAGDGIDAVADAAEDVTEAITEAPGDLLDGAAKYGSAAAISTLGLAEAVVDFPGDTVGWTGELTADVIGGAVGLVSDDAGDSVADTIQGGTDFVAGALHTPGDVIGAVSDLIPDPFEEDEVGSEQAELTQLTAPTGIPAGAMAAGGTVIGAIELPTEQEGEEEEEMPQALIAEDTGLGTGILAGSVTAAEAIITTPTEQEGEEEEMLQPLVAEDSGLAAGVLAGTVGVVGPATESEGEEEEMLQPLTAEDTSTGVLAGAVAATEAIITTPTESDGEEESLQPREVETEPEMTPGDVVDKVQGPVAEVVEDPAERVGGFADKISAGSDSSLDVVEEFAVPPVEPTAERVGQVLERTSEAVAEDPVAELSDAQLEGIGDFGSGAVEAETALDEARNEASADEVGLEELADQDVSDLFADPVAAADEGTDEPVADGFLEGVTESVSDFIDDAKDSVGDAVDAVSDFVEDLFDGE